VAEVLSHTCAILTDSQTIFPTANLRLIFRQVSSNKLVQG
jgi:hypothetical protein